MQERFLESYVQGGNQQSIPVVRSTRSSSLSHGQTVVQSMTSSRFLVVEGPSRQSSLRRVIKAVIPPTPRIQEATTQPVCKELPLIRSNGKKHTEYLSKLLRTQHTSLKVEVEGREDREATTNPAEQSLIDDISQLDFQVTMPTRPTTRSTTSASSQRRRSDITHGNTIQVDKHFQQSSDKLNQPKQYHHQYQITSDDQLTLSVTPTTIAGVRAMRTLRSTTYGGDIRSYKTGITAGIASGELEDTAAQLSGVGGCSDGGGGGGGGGGGELKSSNSQSNQTKLMNAYALQMNVISPVFEVLGNQLCSPMNGIVLNGRTKRTMVTAQQQVNEETGVVEPPPTNQNIRHDIEQQSVTSGIGLKHLGKQFMMLGGEGVEDNPQHRAFMRSLVSFTQASRGKYSFHKLNKQKRELSNISSVCQGRSEEATGGHHNQQTQQQPSQPLQQGLLSRNQSNSCGQQFVFLTPNKKQGKQKKNTTSQGADPNSCCNKVPITQKINRQHNQENINPHTPYHDEPGEESLQQPNENDSPDMASIRKYYNQKYGSKLQQIEANEQQHDASTSCGGGGNLPKHSKNLSYTTPQKQTRGFGRVVKRINGEDLMDNTHFLPWEDDKND